MRTVRCEKWVPTCLPIPFFDFAAPWGTRKIPKRVDDEIRISADEARIPLSLLGEHLDLLSAFRLQCKHEYRWPNTSFVDFREDELMFIALGMHLE